VNFHNAISQSTRSAVQNGSCSTLRKSSIEAHVALVRFRDRSEMGGNAS
jgi:hypothetical protein